MNAQSTTTALASFDQRAAQVTDAWLTRRQLQQLAGCSQMTLKKWLAELETSGIARQVGAGPKARWEYPAAEAIRLVRRRLFELTPEGEPQPGHRRSGPKPRTVAVPLAEHAAPGTQWSTRQIAELRGVTYGAVTDLAAAYGQHAGHPFPPAGQDGLRDSTAVAEWYSWYDETRPGYS